MLIRFLDSLINKLFGDNYEQALIKKLPESLDELVQALESGKISLRYISPSRWSSDCFKIEYDLYTYYYIKGGPELELHPGYYGLTPEQSKRLRTALHRNLSLKKT